MEFVSVEDVILKHNITYVLRKKEMEFVSVEDVIQNTISLTD